MRQAAVSSVLLTVFIAGCASLQAHEEPTPDDRLETGLAALAQQDFQRARDLLEPVYREHWQEPEGQRALLALAAAELDSRNPERRLWQASEYSARYLNIDGTPPWTTPVAETLYLLAVELGGQEEELARAEAEKQEAEAALRAAQQNTRKLPESTRETVPARLRQVAAERDKVAAERDELQRRVTLLEQRVAARDKDLKTAQQELERIRRTLKK